MRFNKNHISFKVASLFSGVFSHESFTNIPRMTAMVTCAFPLFFFVECHSQISRHVYLNAMIYPVCIIECTLQPRWLANSHTNAGQLISNHVRQVQLSFESCVFLLCMSCEPSHDNVTRCHTVLEPCGKENETPETWHYRCVILFKLLGV